MARFRKTLGDLLQTQAQVGRDARAITLSVPAMEPVGADGIQPGAVTAEKLAENAVILSSLDTDLQTNLSDLNTNLTQAQADVTQAQSDVAQAQTDIASVTTTANNASSAASAAQASADSAATAASNAQTAANNAQTAASNASTAASTADGKAVAAQSKADQASTDAATAQTAANNAATAAATADGKAVTAQNTANGKNKVIYSTSTASGANTAGDIWFQKDANNVILAQWEGTGGTSWSQKTISGAVLAALDAGKITTGTLAAGVLDAATIRAKFIAAGLITAADITAGTLTSASGIFGTMDASVLNAGTINAARLVAGDIRAAFLTAGKVTAADMVAGTLTSASGVFGTLDASILNAGTLNAARIAAGSMTADKLLVGGSTNALPDPSLSNSTITSARLVRSAGGTAGWTINAGSATVPASVTRVTTSTNDVFHYVTAAPAGSNPSYGIPAVAGQKWVMSVDVETAASAGVRWDLYTWKADGTVAFIAASGFNTAAGKRTLTYVYTVPAGVIALYPAVACNVSGATFTVYGNAVFALQSGATLIEDGSITAVELAADSVTATQIKAGEVIAGKLATGAVVADNIAANAVTAVKILAGEIGTNHMAAGSINADRLTAATITAGLLSATAIDGKTITGATVRATGATGTVAAVLGPTSVWDAGSAKAVPGIGFMPSANIDLPLTGTTAGMYSTDSQKLSLTMGGQGGANGGATLDLGPNATTGNSEANLWSWGGTNIQSRGSVTLNSQVGAVLAQGSSLQLAGSSGTGNIPITGVSGLNGYVADTAWQNITPVNGWSNYGGEFATLQYRKLLTGQVEVRGLIKGSLGPDCGSLPAAYRPNATLIFPAIFYNGTTGAYGATHLYVRAAGGLSVMGAGAVAYIQINATFFPGS